MSKLLITTSLALMLCACSSPEPAALTEPVASEQDRAPDSLPAAQMKPAPDVAADPATDRDVSPAQPTGIPEGAYPAIGAPVPDAVEKAEWEADMAARKANMAEGEADADERSSVPQSE